MIDPRELEHLWRSGESVARLAKRYGVHFSHIYRLRRRHGLTVEMQNGSHEPPAPSPEDDQASKSSTRLAPYVQHRLAVLRAAWALREEMLMVEYATRRE